MAIIISSDTIKESLPGYDPNDAERFHSKSTKMADKAFEDALISHKSKKVIITSGGSASGKSEYVSVYLQVQDCIVYDGTLSSFERAEMKISRSLKHNKNVEIHAIWPIDFPTALLAFMNRERKFSIDHFYRTHISSRKTLLRIAREYPDLSISIIISRVEPDNKMRFTTLTDKNRAELVEFLEQSQYTEEKIKLALNLYDI